MERLRCVNEKPLKGNEVAPPVKAGEMYDLSPAEDNLSHDVISIVNGIYTCKCGERHYNVGIKTNMTIKGTDLLDPEHKHIGYVTCINCRERLPFSEAEKATYPIWWAHPSRFEEVADSSRPTHPEYEA